MIGIAMRRFGWVLGLTAIVIACGGHALPEPRGGVSPTPSAGGEGPEEPDVDALDPADVSMTSAEYDATTTVAGIPARDLLDRAEVVVLFETLDVTLKPSVEAKLRTAAGLAARALGDDDVRRRIVEQGHYAQAYRLFPARHAVTTNDEILRALLDGNKGDSQIVLRLKLEGRASPYR